MPLKASFPRLLSLPTISLLVLWAVAFPQLTEAHSEGPTAEQFIHMQPQGYEPRALTIPAGTTVVFENKSNTDVWPASNIHPTHEIYPEFDPGQPVAAGQSWRFTFQQPGTWTYHDHLYPTVTGTITVVEPEYAVIPALADAQDWLTQTGQSLYAALWGRPRLPYTLYPNIAQDSAAIYTDVNALYSYIHVYGLPATMQHLTDLSARLGTCHDTAHRAGRIAYELLGDTAFTSCSAACHSGCYHGATEYFFREHGTDRLTENLATLCSTKLNNFISHQCIHGIGHGLMAWTNYELPEALRACDLLDRQQASCYTGVFMENVVGSLGEETDGHFTKYVSDDPRFPCNFVPERYASACYFYQTSRMLQLFGADWPAIAAACAEAPTRFHRHCFESMGRDVGGRHPTDTAAAITACRSISDLTNRRACLNGAVQNYFWEPAGQTAARAFCQALSLPNEKSACYTVIAQRAADVLPTRAEKEEFCNQVEPAWRAACRTTVVL